MQPGTSQQSTFWPEERPASPSPSRANAAASPTNAATYASLSAKWPITSIQPGYSGKTYPASLVQWIMRSDACWENYVALVPPSNRQQDGNTSLAAWWPDPGEPWHGGSWTPNGTEYPNAADVSLSLLQEVLETGPLPTRYFLSETACQGILRRAAKRGKKLPPALERALKARIGTAAPIPPSEPSPPASA